MKHSNIIVRKFAIAILVLALVVANLATGPSAARAQGDADLGFSQQSVTLGEGENTFTATAQVQTAGQEVNSLDVVISYDSSLLATDAASITETGPLTGFIGPTVNQAQGTIRYVALSTDPSVEINTAFSYLEIEFEVLTDITSTEVTYVNPGDDSDVANNGLSVLGEAFSLTVNGPAPANDCSPISPLPCGDVPVSLPFALDWSADEGDILDGDGVGTGFTMVDPPSARLASDNPVSNPDVPGYEADLLDVDTATPGTLSIEATKGIAFSQPNSQAQGQEANSSDTNSQLNALGVGVDVEGPIRIETTLVDLPSLGGNNFQQAGLYFGLNENNFIKVAYLNANGGNAKIQLGGETDDSGTFVLLDNQESSNFSQLGNGDSLTLVAEIDPATNQVEGFFSINGGAETSVGTLAIPASFTNGTDHDGDAGTDALSYAGIFGSTRRAAVSANLIFNFDDFSIVSNAPNAAPVAVDDGATTDEDTASDPIAVLANDTDDGTLDATSVTVVSAPANGTATANVDGTITYTPEPDFNGSDSFTYTVDDNEGETSNEATVTVTVNDVNDDPVADDDADTTDEDTAVDINVLEGDVDEDGTIDPTSVTVVSAPSNGTAAANVDGTITYAPNADFNGSDSFTYTVNDDDGATSNEATVTVTVNAVNDAPVAVDDSYGTNEETALTVDAPGVLDNDTDAENNALTAALASDVSNGTLVLNADGSFTYTPDAGFSGSDSFTYTANDGTADSAPATVTITVNDVNDAPEANDQDVETDEDINLPIILTASDADGDDLTFTVTVQPTNGVLSGNGAELTYDPNDNFNGSDSFTFEVNDGNGGTGTGTVNITVNPVNDAPVAVDDSYGTDEDTPLTVAAPGVLDNDTDADSGDTLAAVLDTDVSNGTLVLNADGSFTYTPDAGFSGTDSFTYVANDGTVDSAPATVTIAVNDVNDTPVANDDNYDVDEDATLTVDAPGVLDNDTDADSGDTLTASLETDVSNGTLTLNSDGSFSYTPNANFFGEDSFTYIANDGTEDSTPAAVTIAVNAVNDAPVAVDDSYGTNEETPLTVDAPGVLSNDTDVDDEVLTATLATDAASGTLVLNADGSFSYTPDAGFSGTDSFTYVANDGTADSAPATVTIAVNDVNDAPDADDQSVTTDEDTPVDITLTASDPDNNSLTYTVTGGPSNGTLSGTAPNLTYTPNANYFGGDSFTFEVSDGNGGTDSATVTITVDDINDAPIADDDSATTTEDQAVDINVLDGDEDIDGTLVAASVTVVSAPTSGTATANANGSITYTPNGGFSGGDSFTYTVDDDDGAASNEATVSVTVQADDNVVLCVNAGGGAYESPITGRSFLASQYLSGGRAFPVPPAGPKNVAIANTDDDLIYQTEYSSGNDNQGFSAEIPLESGVYDVELYFAEIYFGSAVQPSSTGGAGKRVFNYSLEGGQASLSGYDIFARVGADAAEVMSYPGIAVTDGGLNLTFTATTNQPKLSALCVLESDVVIVDDATLNGSLALEGRSDQSDVLTVDLYEVGGDTPVFSFTPTSDASGDFSVGGVEPGTYEVAVKQANHLQVVQTVTLTPGANSVAFGELPAGDANNDNRVELLDFSILANGFDQEAGDPGYDGRADFNGDEAVDLLDFSLLAGRFDQVGQTPSGVTAAAAAPDTDIPTVSEGVVLRAQPSADRVSVGEAFDLVLLVDAGERTVDAAGALLSIDSALLEIVSVDASEALNTVLLSERDGDVVRHEAGKLGTPFPSGDVELATVRLRAVAAGEASVTFEPGSSVYRAGELVLGEAVNASVTVVDASEEQDEVQETELGFRLFLPITQK